MFVAREDCLHALSCTDSFINIYTQHWKAITLSGVCIRAHYICRNHSYSALHKFNPIFFAFRIAQFGDFNDFYSFFVFLEMKYPIFFNTWLPILKQIRRYSAEAGENWIEKFTRTLKYLKVCQEPGHTLIYLIDTHLKLVDSLKNGPWLHGLYLNVSILAHLQYIYNIFQDEKSCFTPLRMVVS